MLFKVMDGDDMTDDDLIGQLETTMGDIMGARGQCLAKDLKRTASDTDKRGQIIVRGEGVQESNLAVNMKLDWANLNNVAGGCMGMCPETMSTKIKIERNVGGTYKKVWEGKYTSTEGRNNATISKMGITELCNCDDDAELRVCVVNNSNTEINAITTSLGRLKRGELSYNGAAGAMLTVSNFEVFVRPGFVDYLRSGVQVSLVCAIDYTASNGNQAMPNSLHAMGPQNQYEKAIYSVGQIVEPYDADRSFPTFGFGGVPNHMGMPQVSHCFPLNGNPQNPSIVGIQGIIDVYRQTLPQIQLSGPTYFAPLLQQFKAYVQQCAADNIYQILLLNTDGIIMDME